MKKLLSKMNLSLLGLTILYSILGCIMIYSASSVLTVLKQGVASNYYFLRQVAILIISIFVTIIVTRFPLGSYKYFSYPLVIGIGASLVGLLLAGKITNGTKGWYDLGFFNLQPAEFAKSIIIIYLATSYEKLVKKKESRTIIYFLPLCVAMIIALLVLKQPDLGSAIIIGALSLMIFLSVPMPKKNHHQACLGLLIVGIVGISLCMAFKDKIFTEYQLSRFSFLAPCSSEKRNERLGYQVCNGYIAIKNGGLFGLGFGNSTQKYLYLPEAHTDFIFPIIVEELGLVTGILIILGYIIMLREILKIAKNALTVSNSLIAYGTACYLGLHILVNLLGVLGLMPLTGVPLPFFSYGGSFAINAIMMIGITEKIAIETKNNKFRAKIINL